MSVLGPILRQQRLVLLVGNGINRHNGDKSSSWNGLLDKLAAKWNPTLCVTETSDMSNTEFFDILDIDRGKQDPAKSKIGRRNLQEEFSNLMGSWKPADHHKKIVGWALQHETPIITVNFDENLSRAVRADFWRAKKRFTHYYPWSSYFSNRQIDDPRSNFAIWHAHGMMRYKTSIRLGLRHYMGSVQRARGWIYNSSDGLLTKAHNGENCPDWQGSDTWLQSFFFCPILMLGFGFGKDETFLRWLFLERALLHRTRPDWKEKTWFVDTEKPTDPVKRRPFLEGLGIEVVTVKDHADIYEDPAWLR